jgi:hypothetical protein
MKLFYDPITDELIEAGYLKHLLVSRDSVGNVSIINSFDNLILIGDIYSEPISLNKKLRLSKIVQNVPNPIIEGFATEHQIQEGCRFNIELFNYYSTNLVVSVVNLQNSIEFFTLSGSHYLLEYV